MGMTLGKCSVVLMYEGGPRPLPLGMTENHRLKVLVKRQIIKEAEEALRGAQILKDVVLIAHFGAELDKLGDTLDLLLPPDLEASFLSDNNGG